MTRTRVNSTRRRELRAIVARRDGVRCFYCRTRPGSLAELTLDHLVPRAHGGPWTAANLVLACELCNQAKGDKHPQAFIRGAGFAPGLRPRGLEAARRAVAGTARAARMAALIPAAVVALVLTLR